MTTATTKPLDLDFPENCRGEVRNGWKRRIYASPDGPYRVVHHHCLMGRSRRKPQTSYADYWSAEVLRPGLYYRDGRAYQPSGWDVLSRHKKRLRAEQACREHNRANSPNGC